MRREIFVPWKRVQIKVEQAPTEVRERIRATIRGTHELRAFSQEEPFWIVKKISYQNAYLALALIRIDSGASSSWLQITFVPPGVILMFGAMALITYLMALHRVGSFSILVFLFFLFTHIASSALFVYEADWIEQQLRKGVLTDRNGT